MIQARNIKKIYKGDMFETVALNGVSLHVEDGEFVAIMGESGSGKSTLLHILGGMDVLTEGTLEINGVVLNEASRKQTDRFRRQNISFIFQHFALMDEYTVYQNMESPLLARGIKRKMQNRMIMDELEHLGIADLQDKYPSQLSGGQQQRVAIARALVSDTPIVLADEPTGALDEHNTRIVMELFKQMNALGKTVIIITHDQNVAAYAKRIIVLKNGEIFNG